MKELKVEVPQGYEIDKENSTFESMKFKKKKQVDIKTWNDLCEAGDVSDEIRLSGYCLDEDSNICMAHRLRVNNRNRNVFATEKEAKSARAASMISQLMPYYGGAITDEEWSNSDIPKYSLTRIGYTICTDFCLREHNLLSFRAEKYRDEFLKHNEQLVKDYLMID